MPVVAVLLIVVTMNVLAVLLTALLSLVELSNIVRGTASVGPETKLRVLPSVVVQRDELAASENMI